MKEKLIEKMVCERLKSFFQSPVVLFGMGASFSVDSQFVIDAMNLLTASSEEFSRLKNYLTKLRGQANFKILTNSSQKVSYKKLNSKK